MKRELDWFIKVKILAVEVASTVVFVCLVFYAAIWEIRHLIGR